MMLIVGPAERPNSAGKFDNWICTASTASIGGETLYEAPVREFIEMLPSTLKLLLLLRLPCTNIARIACGDWVAMLSLPELMTPGSIEISSSGSRDMDVRLSM